LKNKTISVKIEKLNTDNSLFGTILESRLSWSSFPFL
jgi:hypothetical protein